MVILYLALVCLLGLAGAFVRLKAGRAKASLDDHHERLASLAAEPKSTSYNDVGYMLKVAKVTKAADAREAAERHHDKWSARHEAIANLRRALTGWRGRKAPYALGLLDAFGLLGLIDLAGLHGQVGDLVVTFVKHFFSAAGNG